MRRPSGSRSASRSVGRSVSRSVSRSLAILVATVALCACDDDSARSGDAVGEAPSPEATATASPFAPSPAQVSAGCGAPEIGVGEGLALRGLVVSAERAEGAAIEPGSGWVAVTITIDSTSGDDDLPSGRSVDPGASFDVLILEPDLPLPAAGSCLIARGHEGSPDCGPACDAYGFIADEYALYPP